MLKSLMIEPNQSQKLNVRPGATYFWALVQSTSSLLHLPFYANTYLSSNSLSCHVAFFNNENF